MRKKKFYLQPLAVAVVATFANLSFAQQEADDLPPMVVTGVGQTSALTVVTNPKLPRQPIPASDGADYLKTIPGFSALRSGGVNSDPVFRGMFGSRLKLLTNGGEMLGACPSRMDSSSSYISPESYDKLTVIKGPQTVQWGPGNSAATILFERGPEEFYDLGTRLDASFLTGSNGRLDSNLDTALGNNLGYVRLMANTSKADDYKDGDGKKVPSKWDKYSADLALGYTPTADTWLEISAGGGDGEARYAGRGMDGTQFKRESFNVHFKQSNLSATWQTLEAQIYYNYADHIMDNYKLRKAPNNPSAAMPMMQGPFASQVDRETYGGRLKTNLQLSTFEMLLGIDGQTNNHSARRGPADNFKQEARVKDAEFTQLGVFAENTYNLASEQRLFSGIRFDRHQAKDLRTGALLNKRDKNLTSGFLRYEQDMAKQITSYVGLGHNQRFPDYWELFSIANTFATSKPEKTTQLDLGIQQLNGPIELWASAYLGKIQDYLLFDYTAGDSVRNINAYIMGAELGGSHRFTPNWKAETSLAYAWGKNTSDSQPLPQMPPLEAKLAINYEEHKWGAGALVRIVSKQNRIHENSGNVAGKDFGKTSGFALLAVNAAYNFNEHFKTSIGIDNLLDKEYSEHLNLGGNAGFDLSADEAINETGRIYWARLDVKF